MDKVYTIITSLVTVFVGLTICACCVVAIVVVVRAGVVGL